MKPFKLYLQKKRLSRRTIQNHSQNIKLFLSWLKAENLDEKTVNYHQLLAYLDYCRKRGNSSATLSIKMLSLRYYFRYLLDCKLIDESVAEYLTIKHKRKTILANLLEKENLEDVYQNFTQKGIVGKRNKVMLSLLIFQGLSSQDISHLRVEYLKLSDGEITIPDHSGLNGRTLALEAFQILDLQNYITKTRELLLALTDKESDALIISSGSSQNIRALVDKLIQLLRKQFPFIVSMSQIRSSVISNWLKSEDVRLVQYKAGHKKVTSTENFKQSLIEDLQDEVSKYHPLG